MMDRVLAMLMVLTAASAFGFWFRSREGRLRDEPRPVPDASPAVEVEPADQAHHGGEVLTAGQLGSELGERVTVVQFSSGFCQPCTATRQLLLEISETVPGLAHIDLDVEEHMGLVRELGIRRTPTVLILDESGAIRKRAVGLPRKNDLVAAVAAVV